MIGRQKIMFTERRTQGEEKQKKFFFKYSSPGIEKDVSECVCIYNTPRPKANIFYMGKEGFFFLQAPKSKRNMIHISFIGDLIKLQHEFQTLQEKEAKINHLLGPVCFVVKCFSSPVFSGTEWLFGWLNYTQLIFPQWLSPTANNKSFTLNSRLSWSRKLYPGLTRWS